MIACNIRKAAAEKISALMEDHCPAWESFTTACSLTRTHTHFVRHSHAKEHHSHLLTSPLMRRGDYKRIKQHVGLITKNHSSCCFEVLMPRQTSYLLLTVGVDFNVFADTVKGIQVLGRRITGVNPSQWVMSGDFERQASNIFRMVAKQQFCVSLWTKNCLSEASVHTFVNFLSLITREQTERLNVAERHWT